MGRVTLGPSASDQWVNAPEHLAMVLARYRAASALIGDARTVLEVGCGEGIGARILAAGRRAYYGWDCDRRAVSVGREMLDEGEIRIAQHDIFGPSVPAAHDAAVALDVIEHVGDGEAFMAAIVSYLRPGGVCVIGTPNAAFAHLASPQSRAAHVNLYAHDRLHALMSKHFRLVQSFGMQDTSLHLGHPEARHYLLMCGIGPR